MLIAAAIRKSRNDPRANLLAFLSALGVVLLTNSVIKLTICLILCCLSTVILKKFSLWINYCRLLVPLIVMLFAFTLLSGENLESPLQSTFKLVTLGSLFFFFLQLTPPEELAFALMLWRLPFGIAFIFAYSLRYVEILERQWQQIFEAQKLRGLVLHGLGWRHLPSLLGPLLIQVFRLGDELAEALETRGFGTPARTLPLDFRLTWQDYTIILTAWAFAISFYFI